MLHPMLTFLKKGMSAEKLSLTLALGICFGIMPFMGVTTYLLIPIALVLRLNIPAIQLVNYAVYFVQIVLFVPFLKIGQFLFHGPQLPFELTNIVSKFKNEFWNTLGAIWEVNLLGIVVWIIVSIPLAFLIYRLSLPFFARQQQKLELELA